MKSSGKEVDITMYLAMVWAGRVLNLHIRCVKVLPHSLLSQDPATWPLSGGSHNQGL